MIPAPGDWIERGACALPARTGPPTEGDLRRVDAFFGSSPTRAKEICKGCPVKDECLAFALRHRIIDGTWGGMSAKERERLVRAQRNEAAARRAERHVA
jgi:hypothetical protein